MNRRRRDAESISIPITIGKLHLQARDDGSMNLGDSCVDGERERNDLKICRR